MFRAGTAGSCLRRNSGATSVSSMPVSLDTLLAASPYLGELHDRHAGWIAEALADPDAALAGELLAVATAGKGSDEAALAAALRHAKGRVALLAAAAETAEQWSTAASTAALSDLADAALDAGLEFLLR